MPPDMLSSFRYVLSFTTDVLIYSRAVRLMRGAQGNRLVIVIHYLELMVKLLKKRYGCDFAVKDCYLF